MLVGTTGDRVIDIQERPEISDNWYVGGIGSFGWVILVTESLVVNGNSASLPLSAQGSSI
jgi:hypothetical protein